MVASLHQTLIAPEFEAAREGLKVFALDCVNYVNLAFLTTARSCSRAAHIAPKVYAQDRVNYVNLASSPLITCKLGARPSEGWSLSRWCERWREAPACAEARNPLSVRSMDCVNYVNLGVSRQTECGPPVASLWA